MTAHPSDPLAPNPAVLRTAGSRVIATTVGLICAVALVTVMLQARPDRAAGLAGLAVAPAVLAWVLYGHPHLRLSPQGLWIANPFRTHRLPWSEIIGFDRRLGLSVERRTGRPVPAWALPAGGRRFTRGPDGRREISARPSRQIDAVLEAHARFGNSEHIHPPAAESQWNVPNIVVLGLALGWFALGLTMV